MSDSLSTMAAVAAGDSPQPVSTQQSDYNKIGRDAEAAFTSEEDMDAQDAEEFDSEKSIEEAKKAGDISNREAKDLKKKLKLKVDGREIEEEIDFNDDEGLRKKLQKAHGFDGKAREMATLKAQAEQLIHMLQNDPEALLEKMGYNVDELAEKRLSRKVDEMRKSPEELASEKMRKELEELRKEKNKSDEDRKTAEMEKLRNQQAQQIETDITDALDLAGSALPKKNPAIMKRIGETMLFAMKNGYPQVTAKDVIPLVEKQWRQEMKDIFDVSAEDALEELIGKGNLDRYRKHRLSKRSKNETKTAKQVSVDTGTKSDGTKKEVKRISMKDFFKPF